MCGLGLRDGVMVQICRGKAANVLVAHALAPLDILGLLEVDKRKRLRRRRQALELERCASQSSQAGVDGEGGAHQSWRGA